MKTLSLILITLSLSFTAIAGDTNKCIAKTKAGKECSRTVKEVGTKCFQHSETAIRCGSNTSAGTPCKVVVKTAGSKCHNHK